MIFFNFTVHFKTNHIKKRNIPFLKAFIFDFPKVEITNNMKYLTVFISTHNFRIYLDQQDNRHGLPLLFLTFGELNNIVLQSHVQTKSVSKEMWNIPEA